MRKINLALCTSFVSVSRLAIIAIGYEHDFVFVLTWEFYCILGLCV